MLAGGSVPLASGFALAAASQAANRRMPLFSRMGETLQTSAAPTAGAALATESAGFIDAAALAARLGVSVGTVRNWTNSGELPAIRLNCGRLIRYDWGSVRESLLRRQRGGVGQ